jgi:VCBS repeat-containing protein
MGHRGSVWRGRLARAAVAGALVVTLVPPWPALAAATICFTSPSTPEVSAGTQSISADVGDFNHDGKLDFAVANQGSGNVSIRLGNGDGIFHSPGTPEVSVGSGSTSVTVADLNRDGRPDLIVTNQNAGNVSIRLGNGDGTFHSPGTPEVGVGDHPTSATVADFNHDGKPDLAVTNQFSSNVSILLGNGDGTFHPAGSAAISGGIQPYSVASGDFDGDGKLDLAIANRVSNDVVIRRGDGDGMFTTAIPLFYSVGNFPSSIAVGDFNHDGKLDFVTGNSSSNTVSIYLGNGDGTFTPAGTPTLTVGTFPNSVSLGDFDGDGNLDISVANVNSSTVSIRLGNGDGTFTSPATPEFSVGSLPQGVVVGDFNGDGRPDFASANFLSNNVSIRLNCLGAAPVVTVPAAQTTAEDTTLTLSAANSNPIGVADPALGNNPAKVILAVAHGSLTLSTTSSLAFNLGDGTADPTMTFTGTLTHITAALDGLHYIPATDFNGNDQLSITVDDQGANGGGHPVVAGGSVAIAVTAVNDAPKAVADSYAVVTGTTLTIDAPGLLANDTDVDSGSLSAMKVTDPAHGSLPTFNPNGSFSYTPAAGFAGSDSFTYKANDGSLDSITVAVTITVTDTVPTAGNDSYTVAVVPPVTSNPAQPLQVHAPGVLANDVDPDAASLTAALVNTTAHGNLNVNADGSFNYAPNPGYAGPDGFTYTASDGINSSNAATVSINVVNIPPTAGNDGYSITAGTTLTVNKPGVLANDVDPELATLTAVQVTSTAHGNLTLNPDGSFTYTPNAGFTGQDTFTYKADDGTLGQGLTCEGECDTTAQSAPATVTITVGNTAPTAGNDSYAVSAGKNLAIDAPGVLANDVDPDSASLTAVKVTDPAHGSLTLNANGSFSYTPTAGYTGPDSFTYKASDGISQSGAATVSLSVGNVPPTAGDDSYTAVAGTTLTVNAPGVLTNDSDPDSSSLTAAKVSDPAHGSLTLSANGSFSYVPASGFTGPDSFTYKASDGIAQSQVATVRIVVTAVNLPPTAINIAPAAAADTYSTTVQTPLIVPAPGLLGNDNDPDSPSLTAIKVTDPAHGTLSLNANGGFTYTPNTDFYGPDSFIYRSTDGSGLSNTSTVTITVMPTACAPRPHVQTTSTAAGGKLVVHVEPRPQNTAPGNPLSQIRFGTLQNARVTLNGQTMSTGQIVTIPSGTTALDFTVERLTPGQATTVPFTVVDGCGEWPSFVGGGANAGF